MSQLGRPSPRKRPALRGPAERNVFVLQYFRLPYRVVHDLKNHPACRRLDYEDLVQVGFLGLLRACELFDFDRKSPRTGLPVKPITYLYNVVRNWVVTAAYNQAGVVRVPPYAWDAGDSKVRCHAMGDPRGGGSEPAVKGAGPVEEADLLDRQASLRRGMKLLSVREKLMVKLLYRDGAPLKDVARAAGVTTKESVRQRRSRLIKTLKKIILKAPPPDLKP